MYLSSKDQLAEKILQTIKAGGVVKGKAICEACGIGAPYLEQIVAELKTAGLVKAKRGCQGGYQLGKDVITYLDIIMAFNGEKWADHELVWDAVLGDMMKVAEKYTV